MHVESLTRLPRQFPNSAAADLDRLLGGLRWRLGLERLAVAAVHGAIASSIALILLALVGWLTGAEEAALWLAAAPLLVALGLAVARWPSARDTALVVDRRGGLEERLATAVEVLQSGATGRFDLIQVRDAFDHAASAPRGWLALNTRSRNEAGVALLALVVATAIALEMPRLPRPVSSPDQARTEVADLAALDAPPDRGLPIDDSAADQAPTAPIAAAAAPPPADLANRVQQEQAERAALDKLAQGLGSVSAGQGAADAIQQGNFDAAHDQIQSLGEEADQLSDAAKQQLARGLQQAAAASAQSDRALADREQQASQALSRSTYADQRQALSALADQVQRSGARSVPADQLERDQGQLQQQQQAPASSQTAAAQQRQAASAAQPGASTAQPATPGEQGAGQGTQGTGGLSESDAGAAKQGGAGVGTGASTDPFSNQAARLDSSGQQVQVPTKLGGGPGVRPSDGTEDQSSADPSLGGQSVAEQAQAQQTGQVSPEENLVPGEQRPVVRGYFR